MSNSAVEEGVALLRRYNQAETRLVRNPIRFATQVMLTYGSEATPADLATLLKGDGYAVSVARLRSELEALVANRYAKRLPGDRYTALPASENLLNAIGASRQSLIKLGSRKPPKIR